MKAYETRMLETPVHVFYCDRCGVEIPSRRGSGGGQVMTEGASLSSRGGATDTGKDSSWAWLIPIERAPDGTHPPIFNAANIDICEPCLGSLRNWFAEGEVPRE